MQVAAGGDAGDQEGRDVFSVFSQFLAGLRRFAAGRGKLQHESAFPRILHGGFQRIGDDLFHAFCDVVLQVHRCSLECECFRRFREGAEGGTGVFEIKHLGVVIIGAVHGFEAGHFIQHRSFDVAAVIVDQFAGDT